MCLTCIRMYLTHIIPKYLCGRGCCQPCTTDHPAPLPCSMDTSDKTHNNALPTMPMMQTHTTNTNTGIDFPSSKFLHPAVMSLYLKMLLLQRDRRRMDVKGHITVLTNQRLRKCRDTKRAWWRHEAMTDFNERAAGELKGCANSETPTEQWQNE